MVFLHVYVRVGLVGLVVRRDHDRCKVGRHEYDHAHAHELHGLANGHDQYMVHRYAYARVSGQAKGLARLAYIKAADPPRKLGK